MRRGPKGKAQERRKAGDRTSTTTKKREERGGKCTSPRRQQRCTRGRHTRKRGEEEREKSENKQEDKAKGRERGRKNGIQVKAVYEKSRKSRPGLPKGKTGGGKKNSRPNLKD